MTSTLMGTFACLLFLASCGGFKEPDFRGVRDLRVTKFGFGESTLSLDIHYFNPNSTRLKLKKAEGEAWIEGKRLGKFSIDSLVHIPAKGEFKLPVKLKTDMKKVLGSSLFALLADSVKVKVEGKARVGKGFIFINYPLTYEGKFRLNELLKLDGGR